MGIQNQNRRSNSANPQGWERRQGRSLLAPQICTKSFFLTFPVFHLAGSHGAVRKHTHVHICARIQVDSHMCICSHTQVYTPDAELSPDPCLVVLGFAHVSVLTSCLASLEPGIKSKS